MGREQGHRDRCHRATGPSVELPFDVFCDALHFVQAAGADGLADTLIERAAESGYTAEGLVAQEADRD
jgi:hypothetical protein